MKKKLLTLAATALMAVQGHVWAQNPITTYYSEDFQNGKPQNMVYLDGDGMTLTDDLKGTGLECGTWHIVRNSYTDENFFMASTSSFTTPGKANDWMITPSIKIYGTGSTLSWKSMSLSILKKDGLKVYVSTKGTNVEDFDVEPLFSIDAEGGGDWQAHEVSLDKYAGKQIHIAFVNDTYNKYVLCVDDIEVNGPAPNASFQIETPLMTDTGKAQMSIALTNDYADIIQNCKVGYTVKGETYTEEFAGLNLTKGKTTVLTTQTAIDVPLNTTVDYQAWIEVERDRYHSQSGSIRGTYFVSNRRTLLEEATGIWCSACPGGAVALEYLEENYPDNFISIAVHGGQDPLIFDSYINFMGVSAYPSLLTDRKFLHGPMALDESGMNYSLMLGAEYYFLQAQKQMAEAELSGNATLVDPASQKVEVEVQSRFTNDFDEHGFDIALILLEDSVTSPNGALYKQTNGYSSTVYRDVSIYGLKDTLEACGGWAYLPASAPLKFNHVARAAYGDSFNGYGVDNQLPTSLKGGEYYTSKFTWSIPQGVVNNMKYTSIVALMTDENGWVVNACKMYVEADANHIEETMNLTDATPTAIYTPNGLRIYELQKGVNIVEYRGAEGRTFTRKVVK